MELNQSQLDVLVSYLTTAVQGASAQIPLVLEQLVARQLLISVLALLTAITAAVALAIVIRKSGDGAQHGSVLPLFAIIVMCLAFSTIAFVRWLYPAAYLFDTLTGLVR